MRGRWTSDAKEMRGSGFGKFFSPIPATHNKTRAIADALADKLRPQRIPMMR